MFKFIKANLHHSNYFYFSRMILLYGPPGTGKTTLATGLGQKLAIRLKDISNYNYLKLIKINSNQLFSRWFSESPKQIHLLFEKIRKSCERKDEYPNFFVYLVIDEVESLAMNRKNSIKGSEPTDSIRVVNTLLTEIDKLKWIDNILIVCTSNFVELIDPAFLDRIDLKMDIGYPNKNASKTILTKSIESLIRKDLICKEENKKVDDLIEDLADLFEKVKINLN
jgi:SpoVK/Ycf46/Vps4 family AAA+-type ATPase